MCIRDSWREHGTAYATSMTTVAHALAASLDNLGVPVFAKAKGFTTSHQFAIEACNYGGGQTASKVLRESGFLTCGIGLPVASVEGDMNGIRIGASELVRWGVTEEHVPVLADYISRSLGGEKGLAVEVAEYRKNFDQITFING